MICKTCQLKIKEDYAIVHYWNNHRPILLERIREGRKRGRAQKKMDKWV